MATGLAVSFIVALITYSFFSQQGMRALSPKKIVYIFQYFFVFIVALVKANLNVAKIVLSPQLPIKPGIVEFETKLTSDFAKMILANSITLTPGTLSVDIVENRFFVHWLVVECEDEVCAQKKIAEDFEKILLKIYE